jgi:hypothetical protein
VAALFEEGGTMSFDVLGDMNWLAVIVAAIAYYALGALWYSNVALGKAWQRSMGSEVPEGQRPSPAFYIGPLIACLLVSIAIGMLAEATGTDTVGEGLCLGLVVGIGFAGSFLGVTAVFETKKPQRLTWFGITAGYHLVGMLIASLIISAWT